MQTDGHALRYSICHACRVSICVSSSVCVIFCHICTLCNFRVETFWKYCLVPSLPSNGRGTKEIVCRQTDTYFNILSFMYIRQFPVTSAGCAIFWVETFWKSCLVPSLPSTRSDTNLSISNGAIFYLIQPFSSSSACQNDATSSLLFGAHIACMSQHSQAYTEL